MLPQDSLRPSADWSSPAVEVAVEAQGRILAMGFAEAVFVFDLIEIEGNSSVPVTTAWQSTQILRATDSSVFANNSLTHFGSALSASADLLAVGAFGLDGKYGGCVFVYERRLMEGNASVWRWVLEAVLQASDSSPGDLFGELSLFPHPVSLLCWCISSNDVLWLCDM